MTWDSVGQTLLSDGIYLPVWAGESGLSGAQLSSAREAVSAAALNAKKLYEKERADNLGRGLSEESATKGAFQRVRHLLESSVTLGQFNAMAGRILGGDVASHKAVGMNIRESMSIMEATASGAQPTPQPTQQPSMAPTIATTPTLTTPTPTLTTPAPAPTTPTPTPASAPQNKCSSCGKSTSTPGLCSACLARLGAAAEIGSAAANALKRKSDMSLDRESRRLADELRENRRMLDEEKRLSADAEKRFNDNIRSLDQQIGQVAKSQDRQERIQLNLQTILEQHERMLLELERRGIDTSRFRGVFNRMRANAGSGDIAALSALVNEGEARLLRGAYYKAISEK